MLKNRIAELRAKRGKYGISQMRLAQRVGLTRNHLSRLENGNRNPSIETMFKLADYFECPIEDVFTYEPDE